ncbi:MAG: energy-coupling factor ABC transporter ATP-binding protein [Eubacteriaceae bacterium]|jgi:energy-coupling factor transport system ATP-binding protein|nr:energy-coupling factor ABC transporter ATP-binding protein [Eubacteriaceae bacterium]
MQKVIEADNLTFAYEKDRGNVIDGLSFCVGKNTVTVLTGLSGCGKSTVLGIIAGAVPKYTGGVLTGEIKVSGTVGYVMQDPDRQIIATTVEDEIAFGPENICMDPADIRERVDDVMRLLHISDLAEADPSRLSGGQKQLVCIGSVLAFEPDIILMDEPLSHLDEEGKTDVNGVIKMLHETGTTVVIAEHDCDEIDYADSYISLDRPEAEI